MCGIWGVHRRTGGQSLEVLGRMSAALTHRGPDDDGLYVNGPVAMGSRRLSIIDVHHGRQPISNEDESVWIVYNGELYNYRSLRQLLEQAGHVFRTESDTEVIVHLYEEFGEECLEKLRGMYAFAIWDDRRQKLLLGRDRAGQKPLFYAQIGNDFIFASEVKAILAATDMHGGLDFESVHHYLSLRFIPSPQTMFRNIKKLPPAHYLVYEDGQVGIFRYWSLSFRQKLRLSEADLLDSLREKLNETVDLHLTSDVPVGAFLSGGLDSSTIVAIMARHYPAVLKTFAIGVTQPQFDELPYARRVAQRYKTLHVEETVEPDVLAMLPSMVWHLDEPSDPIAACMFSAAALASRHVKVVLGGDGGDELFAGFDRYLGIKNSHYYQMIPQLVRDHLVGPLVHRLPGAFAYKGLSQQLRWLHHVSSGSDLAERYAEATTFFRFTHQEKQLLFQDTWWSAVGDLSSSRVIADEIQNAPADDSIEKLLYADFVTRLPEHSLMLTDRMSMAHSLEVRSPFLDHTLVEFLSSLPSSMKVRGGHLKYALRKLAQEYLPEDIANRPKHGFMFPVAYWFNRELYSLLTPFLIGSHLVRNGIFRREAVEDLIDAHRTGKRDNHARLWMLLSLEIWYQMFIERVSASSIQEKLEVPRRALVPA